ncbi:dihydrofolate synthetase [Phalaenopsis equestris]|uniref:dihydrofolate synthetase n=1 Tax=Phalaenopsis equestris TaxID=78828 RepID=UPI0009E603CA|nr:dihydrofolate synthetase [Phalaenopsis equestris]
MIRARRAPIPPSFGTRRPPAESLAYLLNYQILTRFYSLRQRSKKTMLAYCRFRNSFSHRNLLPFRSFSPHRVNSTLIEDPMLYDFLDYMEQLKNYERIGVPKDAGTDSDDGFDLGRMRRLLQRLGNPQSRFKAVHVAGTKGKGSTAAFISNILREEGYLVGCYTSPHLLTIRERISLGRSGDPVSAELLRDIFYKIRGIIDQSTEMEGGALTHFEVFTALAFALFSEQDVDAAVIEAGLGGARDATNVLCSTGLALSVITSIGEEHLSALGGSLESIAMAKSGIIKPGRPVVIGGPLLPHIEHIIRNKASSSNSPAVSACDSGIKSSTKFLGREEENPFQCCEIRINIKEDLPLFIDLPDVKLQMLGKHQLQNAVTATCAVLCLRNEGWRISDKSIKAGLEKTCLPGRGQYLTKKEVETLGLSGVSILVDGAHTEASAKGLIEIIKMGNLDGPLAFVVSMGTDKDHMAFAMQLLTGRKPDVIILTEAMIAGSRSRTASASNLKATWFRAAENLGMSVLDLGTMEDWKASGFPETFPALINNNVSQVLLMALPNALVGDSMKLAEELLRYRTGKKPHLIVVTGSLHIVSSVLAALHHY